jgi:hypothetical protein
VVAALGTTITPHCFVWQSSQEAEDERVDPAAHTLLAAPGEIGRMRFDTHRGIGYSNVISLFIIVNIAASLNAHGITDIQTSAPGGAATDRGVSNPSPCSPPASSVSRAGCSPAPAPTRSVVRRSAGPPALTASRSR